MTVEDRPYSLHEVFPGPTTVRLLVSGCLGLELYPKQRSKTEHTVWALTEPL